MCSFKIMSALMFLVAGALAAGCAPEPAGPEVPAPATPAAAAPVDDGEELRTMGDWNRAIGALDDCCQQPGQAQECWATDAAGEMGGFVSCSVNADCKSPSTCDLNYHGTGYDGLCTCDDNDDCQDASGKGGVCYTYPNGDQRCGPSWCNGYYICSCWGGCAWWNPDSATITPRDQAAILGLTCCEGTYPGGGTMKFFSSSADCGTGSTVVVPQCDVNTDCDDANDCTVDECIAVGTTRVCSYTITTLAECEADGQWCTIDRCDSSAVCQYSAPRCPADTWMNGMVSEPNTCTLDCNETTDVCHSPLSVPSDTVAKPSSGDCDYWTCSPSGTTVIPEHVVVDCSVFDDDCNTFACLEGSGKDNCADVTMFSGACSSSDPTNVCIAAECLDADSDGVATCDDYNLSPPFVESDPCQMLACDPATGWALGPDPGAVGDSCNDGDLCSGPDECLANGTCDGAATVCADGECVDNECNPANGNCEPVLPYPAGDSCTDTDASLVCTLGECDGAGGCVPQAIACTGTPAECNMRACFDAIFGCADVYDPATFGDPCTLANTPDNCSALCNSQAHTNATLAGLGQSLGVCKPGAAINDTCATALDLGTFTDSGSQVFTAEGSTECGVNDHYTNSTNCLDDDDPWTWAGRYSEDVVYKFSYTTSGKPQVRQRFQILLEVDEYFDGFMYISVGDASCVTTGVPNTPSDINSPSCRWAPWPNNSSQQEDHCYDPLDCTPVSPLYSATTYGGAPSAILHDELLTATPELVTVYIYVDGSRDWSTLYDDGPFFLSVTRNDDCPDPTTWYTGPIHTVIEPGINDLAVPINGSNFPGVTPNTQSGSIGTVPAVLLPGDTRTAGDSFYDGDTDIDTDPYAWKGYDELWQLDILADGVDFSTTLCDYGGWVDLSYDTALDSAVGYTNSTEVTGTDTIWTNPILIDSETVPGSCSQLSGNVQSVAGACFVGGGDQQNCNVVCAGRGGYCDTEYTDSAMFVAATDPVLCESLVDALNWNVPWTAPSAIGAPGVGCGLINWNSATQDLNVPPTCAATPPSNNFRRVCPCVPPPGIDTDTYMGTDSEVVITDTAWETDSYVDTWTEQLSQPFNPMLALFNCWGDRIDWNDDGGDCSGEVPNINPTSAVVQNDGPYYLLVDGRFETGVTGTLEGHEYDLSVYYPGPIPTVPCDPTDTENTTQEYSINLSASDYTLNTQFEYYPSDCIAAAATGWTATYMRINAGDIVPIGTVAQCCDCGGNPTQCAALGCPNVSCFPLTFHYDVWYEDSSTGEICINSGQALQYDRHGNTVDHNVPTPATFGSCDNMIRLGVAYTPPSHLTPTDYAWCQTHCPYTNTIYMRQRSTP